jgi:serine/threonine-protein kinase
VHAAIIGAAAGVHKQQQVLQRCSIVSTRCYTVAIVLMEGGRDGGPAVARDEVSVLLERILVSPGFAGKRRGDLLRYLVERTLAGAADTLTEYASALDVFHKPESFDPRTESTIRAEMSRVRKALAAYYEGEGASDRWRVELGARGYVPSFVPAGTPPAETRPVTVAVARRPLWFAWAAAATVVLSVAALVVWRARSPQPAIRSVVVLPFANLTGDAANDYLADGLTEALTDSLARVASLRVVARTSAFQFKGKAADVRDIGRRVNADAVIEGSLRGTPSLMQVTVQVNRAADGYHILSRVFDGGARDLGRVQHDMALPVLATLRPGTGSTAGRVPDPDAWKLVLQARAAAGNPTQENFNRIVSLLNRAIQQDPEYAEAYAALASAYAAGATAVTLDPAGAAQSARAAAAKAIELDPSCATAYAAEGFADAMLLLEWARGEDELRQAIRLLPQSAKIHQWLGLVLMARGRFEQAMAEARVAVCLDPLSASAGSSPGMILFMQRRYGAAVLEWRKLASLHPDIPFIRQFVGMALEAQGDYPAAKVEYESGRAVYPRDVEFRMALLAAHMGQKQEARRTADELAAVKYDALSLAAVYAAVGDPDRAFEQLERAFAQRACWVLKVHPFLDPLRGDPRYAALLKRSGLAE